MYNCQKVRKRGFKFFLCVLLVCLFSFFWFPKTSIAESQSMKQLIEGAKQEGEIVYYASMGVIGMTAMIAKFEKKYPFMKVKMVRLNSQKLLTRVLAETRAKRYAADVIQTVAFSMHLLIKKGVLGHYVSTENNFYPKDFKEQDYWTCAYFLPYVVAYNTRLVTRENLPKTYDDLLSPKWKGKMMMEPTKVDWFAGMLQIMGREKGLEFMRELSKQDIGQRNGHTLIATLVAAGEAELQINTPTSAPERVKNSGAPIDWVALGPVPGIMIGIGKTSKAAHPNAAKLFVDYVLSAEAQRVMLGDPLFYNSVRSDIAQAAKYKALQVVPVDPASADNITEYSKLLRKIFAR
ncbi:ABC transporter substrate-binding protein [Thermodesulfobacteriota bacterium]